MAKVTINKREIQNHVNAHSSIHTFSLKLDTPTMSFDWVNDNPKARVSIDHVITVQDDLVYNIDLTQIKEYNDLVEENIQLQSQLNEALDKLNSSSSFLTWFSE